ncbi:MAG: NERD domain-containing protein [Candidatus Bathyarchaeota archaeon]|nr:NERD domain-containing protein [Candidatus Bathyarchaeota archaeon]
MGGLLTLGFPIILIFYFFASAGIVALILSVVLLFFGLSFLRNSFAYLSGIRGEREVTRILSSLDDNYALINDATLLSRGGNIDHIVLAPNGVFVIETKNYDGEIACFGDKWIRHYREARYRRNFDLGSPSKQVKSNAIRLKKAIESCEVIRQKRLWIEAVVVFSNKNVILHLNNPTVPVLRSYQLCNHIASRKLNYTLSSQEIDLLGKSILKQLR